MSAEDPQVWAASELLKAAILLRDLMDAMPLAVQAKMPPDIFRRCTSLSYQGAFDALPAEVRDAARAIALADPDVVEARRIDSEGRSR